MEVEGQPIADDGTVSFRCVGEGGGILGLCVWGVCVCGGGGAVVSRGGDLCCCVVHRDDERLEYSHVIRSKHIGEQLSMTVLRDGKVGWAGGSKARKMGRGEQSM